MWLDRGFPAITTICDKVIFRQREEEHEKHIQFKKHAGYIYNIDAKIYTFYDCEFKTPDNLDVIEMAYLYKHWNKKDG